MRLASFVFACIFLAPSTTAADQTDGRLDSLFGSLLITVDLPTIRAAENQIWEIWLQHENSDVEQIMQMGIQRMNYQRYSQAMLIFNQVITSYPNYAEAWNKRATLQYLIGNLDSSITDIEKTLEPPLRRAIRTGSGLYSAQRAEQSKKSIRGLNQDSSQQPECSPESGSGQRKTAFQSDLGISNIGKRSEYTQEERVIYPASVSTQTVGKT